MVLISGLVFALVKKKFFIALLSFSEVNLATVSFSKQLIP